MYGNKVEIDFGNMGDALMNWEAGRSRWRKKYKGKWLQVSPSALGGTNATDTKLAANQWYREQQAQRDKELALETPRSNEWWEYRRELECVQSAINTLSAVMRSDPETRSMLVPKIELLKQKEVLILKVLGGSTLPPLVDALRNPLQVSPEGIEREAIQEVQQQITDRLYGQTQSPFDYLFLRSLPVDVDQNPVSYVGMASNQPTFTTTNGNSEPSVYDQRVQAVAEAIAGLKDGVVARKKKELGLIENEYERGIISQLVKEHGTAVPESRKLDYHIAKFLEYHHRRYAEKKIGGTSLDRIIRMIKSYTDWSPIINGNVDRIGTKEHIDAYYKEVGDRKIAGKIGAEYANKLIGTFKTLIGWLVDEEVLQTYPVCLQRKNRYTFPIELPKPESIPLEWVHKVLDTANPRLKLCILLTLNIGAGAAEIAQIRKDEYNPSTGRITRRRSKTRKSRTAPTVCYKLWDITKALLDQEIANCRQYPKRPLSADCLLTNRNGMPLWYTTVTDGKPRTSCSISEAFDKLMAKLETTYPDMPKFTYYQFRKTSASLIKNEPRYRVLNELWLAHAPRSVADRHYNADEDTILDDCLAWLHDKIFGFTPPSKGQKC